MNLKRLKTLSLSAVLGLISSFPVTAHHFQEIRVHNHCSKTVDFAIKYKNREGGWVDYGFSRKLRSGYTRNIVGHNTYSPGIYYHWRYSYADGEIKSGHIHRFKNIRLKMHYVEDNRGSFVDVRLCSARYKG